MLNRNNKYNYLYICILIKLLIGSLIGLILGAKRLKAAGQMLTEYVIVFGLVAVALTASSMYVRRGLQGKFKDATDWALNTIVAAHCIYTAEQIYNPIQYEPYYNESIVQSAYFIYDRDLYGDGGANTKTPNEHYFSESEKEIFPFGAIR